MDKFLTIKSSGTAHRKVRLAYYLIPMFVFTSISLSHFASTSFGIYLKHQALIDTYHNQQLDARYKELSAEDNDVDSARKRQQQQNEKIISNSIIAPPMS